jgi:hypothetical protein
MRGSPQFGNERFYVAGFLDLAGRTDAPRECWAHR